MPTKMIIVEDLNGKFYVNAIDGRGRTKKAAMELVEKTGAMSVPLFRRARGTTTTVRFSKTKAGHTIDDEKTKVSPPKQAKKKRSTASKKKSKRVTQRGLDRGFGIFGL